MKKQWIVVAVLSLMLTGCTANEEPVNPEPKPEVEQSGALEVFGELQDDTALIIANEPTEEMRSAFGTVEELTLTEGGESILIVPTMENTQLQIFSLQYDEYINDMRRYELVYEVNRTPEDFALELKLTRPDTMPGYMVIAQTEDGAASYYFSEDLKDGLAPIEQVTIEEPTAEDYFKYEEMGYIFTYTEEEVIALLGEPAKIEEYEFLWEDKARQLVYDEEGTFDILDRVFMAQLATDAVKHPRDVKIGDPLDEVVAKFPNEGDGTKYPYDGDAEKEYSLLYGEYMHMQDFGMIEYVDGTPVAIAYSSEGSMVRYMITDGKVSSVMYQIPTT